MSAPERDPITIVGVEVHNFHRLEVAQVEHVPGVGLVRVTGKNKAGKTSLLKAIAGTLGGAAQVRREPIRVGDRVRLVEDGELAPDPVEPEEDDGSLTRLVLSNGFRLTRTYTEANPKGYLTVQGPDGGRHGQSKLDGWLGPLAFDPLGFYGLKEDRQRDVLLSLGGNPDLPAQLADVRRRQAEVYAERTPWISQQRAAARITRPAGERPVPVDTKAELQRMGELQALERRRADALRDHDRTVERARQELADRRRKAAEDVRAAGIEKAAAQHGWQAATNRIVELEEQLVQARRQLEAALDRGARADQAVLAAERILAAVAEAEDAWEEPPPPELPEDPTEAMEEVRARIEAAEGTLASLEPWRRYDDAQRSLDEAAAQVEELTVRHKALQEEERQLVAAAGIPVRGVSFGEAGEPLLNGLPLEVASGAEKIGLAVEVAVAANPELRVALVDEANDMDEDSLAELDRLARAKGFQVWACRLGLEGPGEVVVSQGYAADNPAPAPLPAPVLGLDGRL